MANPVVKLTIASVILFLSISQCHTIHNTGDRNDIAGPEKSGRPSRSGNIKSEDEITICTFNIQFLGAFRKRDNRSLADVIKDYDIVVIQELVAPPINGIYPDGTQFNKDPESASFKDAMKEHGFKFILSEEDTGTGETIHSAGTGTEWFICFYDSTTVCTAPTLPHGFLAADRSDNPDYERVPYAFPFRPVNGNNDFVLISVHLDPGESRSDQARRIHEISTIYGWIEDHNQSEKDFIILGDMNIDDKHELADIMPVAMKSLNDECRVTNTLVNDDPPDFGGKPYDQVFYFPAFTGTEIDTVFDCKVIDLKMVMKPYWHGPGPYPGDPYNHDVFRQYYSDHNPLIFRIRVENSDDD